MVAEVEFSGTFVAMVVGMVLSLLVEFAPGFSGWWETFGHKREGMAGAGLVVTAALLGLHYAGAVDLGLGAFGWPVIWAAVRVWLTFIGAGQATYTAIRGQLARNRWEI